MALFNAKNTLSSNSLCRVNKKSKADLYISAGFLWRIKYSF